VIWLVFAGGAVLVAFAWWERRRAELGRAVLVEPAMLRNLPLRNGIVSFLFMYLILAGVFFTIPLFLSIALGLSAVVTGVRLLPLSLSLLVFAAGIPRVLPNVSPRRVVRLGFLALFAGLVLLVALLDAGAGPEIVTWPLLLAGAGLGALASQLGAVTVSAVPDEKSGEVGGLQNTGSQLGSSIGTALAGAVLISALSASFFSGIENNPNVPKSVVSQGHTQLASGVPFVSDADLKKALDEANVPEATANEIVKANETARIRGLRTSSAVLALLALVALPFTRGIPTLQPGASPDPAPA
jgi:energy-coupling factor transporter transmembrane protein EcfT